MLVEFELKNESWSGNLDRACPWQMKKAHCSAKSTTGKGGSFCLRHHPFFCVLQRRCGSRARKLGCTSPLGTFACVWSLAMLAFLFCEGENVHSRLPFQPTAASASLFPASSTIALKLLGCSSVQAASKSCLKMARYDDRHLITVPKIHRPRIALCIWGKRKRRPRTVTLQVSHPGKGHRRFRHLLTNSQALMTLGRLDWLSWLSPASWVGLTSCPASA